MKTWTCTQCGKSVTKGIVASAGGAPEECESCDNTEFEEPVVMGTVHSAIDQRLP